MKPTDHTRRDSVLGATAAALPLYVASTLVTLAGVGSVGVTATTGSWLTIWSCLVVLGHLASLGLRLIGVQPLPLFFPVMAVGGGLAIRLAMDGSTLIGFDDSMLNLPVDMATSVLLALLATVRTFTLVTNASLLFSIVPVIAMLALVGSSNPNAEVLLFFGLAVLGGLFTSGYELHVRRSLEAGRPPAPVLLHLISAWAVTLTVALAALVGPVAVQPALAPLSPFAFSQRLRNLVNINPINQQQTPVGQGPITLSPTVVYEIYTNSGRKFRTGVYTVYTGRSWTAGDDAPVATVRTDQSVQVTDLPPGFPVAEQKLNLFTFPGDPSRPLSLDREQIQQLIVTRARNAEAIPAQGWVRSLGYPQPVVSVSESGMILGNSHTFPDRMVQLTAEAVDPPPDLLRKAPAIDPNEFWDTDTLMLPQSTYDVQVLAREVTADAANSFDKVMSIMRHIETTCSYTLQGEYTPQGEDAAAHYLFKSRRGACDLAATAGAVMSRAVGVPSRIVVGYVADEPLPSGNGYLVRQEHAHMWFECYFSGYGWVEFDPAPPSADIQDSPWDILLASIRRALSRVGGGGLDAALLVSVVLITFLMAAYRLFLNWRRRLARRAHRRRSDSPAGAIAAQYHLALAALARRGWRREPHMTPSEYLAGLAVAWANEQALIDSLSELTQLHEAAVYGGRAGEPEVQRAREAARAVIRRAPRRARGDRRTPAPAPAAS